MGKHCLILFVDDVESGFKGTSLIHPPHLLPHMDNLGMSSELKSAFFSTNGVQLHLQYELRALEFGRVGLRRS